MGSWVVDPESEMDPALTTPMGARGTSSAQSKPAQRTRLEIQILVTIKITTAGAGTQMCLGAEDKVSSFRDLHCLVLWDLVLSAL